MSKKDEKLLNKVERLNDAYRGVRPALKVIKKLFPKDEGIQHCLCNIERELARMNKYILKLLEDEIVGDEFRGIMKQLKEK